MIGKIFEKKSIKALFKYVKKDDAKYIGGSLLMSNEDEFLKSPNYYIENAFDKSERRFKYRETC